MSTLIAKIKPDDRRRVTIPNYYLKANNIDWDTIEIYSDNKIRKDELIIRFITEEKE